MAEEVFLSSEHRNRCISELQKQVSNVVATIEFDRILKCTGEYIREYIMYCKIGNHLVQYYNTKKFRSFVHFYKHVVFS